MIANHFPTFRNQILPKAVVHIGPHKTSSTFMQMTMVKLAKELRDEGYFWPCLSDGTVLDHKSTSSLAIALKNGTAATPQKDALLSFVAESRRLNRNIILSSEEFDYAQIEAVKALRDALTGFNVMIVFVYREQLAQLNSIHFQLSRYDKANISNGTLVSAFLFKSLDDPPHFVQAVAILDRFAQVFGRESLRVIDLAGVNAARKNIAHVMVCEVVGVMCHQAHLFSSGGNSSSSASNNAAYSLVPAHVFTILKGVIATRGSGSCQLCGPQIDDYEYFAARLQRLNDTNKLPEPLPLVTSRLAMLHPYAKLVDAAFRDKYGSLLLYNNPAATVRNLERMKVEELQTDSFVTNPVWKRWIIQQFHHFKNAKKLCGC